jgi:replication factor A1
MIAYIVFLTYFLGVLTNRMCSLVSDVRVDEFNGKKLSSINQTLFQVNETSSWAQELKKWYQLNNQASFSSLTTSSWMNDSRNSERLCIAELREQALKKAGVDLEDRGLWFTCYATLVSIDRDRQFYWIACPKCGKKVIPVTDEIQDYTKNDNVASYVCPGCSTQVEHPVRKYLLNLVISDTTGSLPCTAMGDRGTSVMGSVTPDSLVQLQMNENDPQTHKRCEDFFYERLRKEYLFTIQAKSETYRDETRVRYRVFGVQPINAIKADDAPNGPNGIETCRLNLIKEAKRGLNIIYSRIPRE